MKIGCKILLDTNLDSIDIKINNQTYSEDNNFYAFNIRSYQLEQSYSKNIENIDLIIHANEKDGQIETPYINLYIGNTKDVEILSWFLYLTKTGVTLFSAFFSLLFFIYLSISYLVYKRKILKPLIFYSIISTLYLISFSRLPRLIINSRLSAGNIHYFLRILQDFTLFYLFSRFLSGKRYIFEYLLNIIYLLVISLFVICFFIDQTYFTSYQIIFYSAPLVALPMGWALFLSTKLKNRFEKNILVPMTTILFIFQLNDLLTFWQFIDSYYTVKFYIPLLIVMLSVIDISRLIRKSLENQSKAEFINTARQVAHDIRSPLTALKMTLDDTNSLKPDTKSILINSINRIEDISNNLLDRSRTNSVLLRDHIHVLSFLSELMSQKRAEYKTHNNVFIDTKFSTSSYSAFIDANKTKFSVILSNIINNSIESCKSNDANILVEAISIKNNTIIKIIDNGPGIPKDIINQLGHKPISYNKNNGNGLGLIKAFEIINELNGKVAIVSDNDIGTTVTISIPKITPPLWFQSEIYLKNKLIILDDDIGIQQTWLKRFNQENLKFDEIKIFQSPTKLLSFINTVNVSDYSFLLDFEINNFEINGLDIIKKLSDNEKNNFLITSYYEDFDIQRGVIDHKAKIVPKPFLAIVPILKQIIPELIILIDDDSIIKNSWIRLAKKKNLSILVYSHVDDFLNDKPLLNDKVYIYIDSNLGDNIKGESEAKKIFEAGYKNIFICSGDLSIDISKSHWIKGIIDKRFPY